MNVDSLIDFANEANERINKYSIKVTLSPDNLMVGNYGLDALNWDSISYGDEELEKVPNDKRGIYAFVICQNDSVLPSHGYVMYIGIAGRKSTRALRARYKDYLNQKKVLKRERIARMIGTWHEVLRFYFAPVEDNFSSEDLEDLEKRLNTALMPPLSEGDLDADTKRQRRAFR